MRNQERKNRVEQYLRDHRHRWIPGYELATPEIGGSEALRRLRELRGEGYCIAKKKMEDSDAYAYRLITEANNA